MQVTMISLDDAENGIRNVCAEDARRPRLVVEDEEAEKPVKCPEFSDYEIGAVVARAMENKDYETIADDVGMDVAEVKRCMLRVRRRLTEQKYMRRSHHAFGEGKSSNPPHRMSKLTPEQQARIHELRREGMTVRQIREAIGCSDGSVRYVLSKGET